MLELIVAWSKGSSPKGLTTTHVALIWGNRPTNGRAPRTAHAIRRGLGELRERIKRWSPKLTLSAQAWTWRPPSATIHSVMVFFTVSIYAMPTSRKHEVISARKGIYWSTWKWWLSSIKFWLITVLSCSCIRLPDSKTKYVNFLTNQTQNMSMDLRELSHVTLSLLLPHSKLSPFIHFMHVFAYRGKQKEGKH
jgi:hypothetical protein